MTDPRFEAVRYAFPEYPWYVRTTYPDGRVAHGLPWGCEEVAGLAVAMERQRWYLAKREHGDLGNGDRCPIDPEHGRMYHLPAQPGEAPKQYCPHVDHDGRSKSQYTPAPIPRTRAIWPVHGFEESVRAHFARHGGMPDLTDMEVTI